MSRPQLTIRRKLILSISVPLLVTYLGLLAWDYYRQRSLTVTQMQQTVLQRADSTAARLDARLSSAEHVTNSLVTLLENPSNRNESQIQAALSGAVRMPWIASATITLDPGNGSPPRSVTRHRGMGTLLANRDTVVVEPVPSEGNAQATSTGTAAWTEPYEQPVGRTKRIRHVCTYVVPIVTDNVVAGSAAVTVDLRELRRLPRGLGGPPDLSPLGGPPAPPQTNSADQPGPPQGPSPAGGRGSNRSDESRPFPPPPPADERRRDTARVTSDELADFVVFGPGGRLIIGPSSEEADLSTETLFTTATRLGQPEMADAARRALAGESQVVRVTGLKQVIRSVPDDTHHWLAMSPIPSAGWLLVTAVPESPNLTPVLQRLWARAAFLAAGLGVLMLVVLGVSVGISRPIERLAAAVDQVAAGDLSAELANVKSPDELGRLAVGFNNMTRQLRHQVAELIGQTAAREKVESELRIARQIQNDLLPTTFPDSHEFALHAVNLPALHVAGDFYDFFFTTGGLLTLVIADVSGKGVPAALVMAVTRTVVRNLAQSGQSLAKIAEATNSTLLSDTSASMFVTMLLCQYEPSTGRLTYVNAGHPPALRLRPGSEPTNVCTVQSPLLGVAADGSMGLFEQHEERLAPGDTLFLYTDGVSETHASDGTLLGSAGVAQFLRPLAGEAPKNICRRTSDQLAELCRGRQGDDITMLALRRLHILN